MKVLHLIPTLSGGGAESQLRYLSLELARRGHEQRIMYRDSGIAPWCAPEVDLIDMRTGHPWSPGLLAAIVTEIRAWKPDIVQTWILQMDVAGGIGATITRVPWVLREPSSPTAHARGAKNAMRLAIARATAGAVIGNSIAGLDYWKENAPTLPRFYIPNAAPLDEIDAVPAGASNRGGLFVGRLIPLKNVDVLIEAARLCDVTLTVCGQGPERERLQTIGGDTVLFAGHTSDVWSRMKAAAFLALLSDHEGRPNVVLEAFAAGVPVILSDIPAHREIADESCAWFAPVGDVAGTAEAIRAILCGGSTVEARIRAARRRVEHSAIRSMADAYLDVYERVRRSHR